MDYIKFIVVVLHVFLFYGCNKVDNFENVDVIRFEKEFYDSDDKNLDSLINKYPFLFLINFQDQLGLRKKAILQKLAFIENPLKFSTIFNWSPKLKLILKMQKKISILFKHQR